MYEFYPISAADKRSIQQMFYFQGALDAYCPGCGLPSVFHRTFPRDIAYLDSSGVVRVGVRDVQFGCSRDDKHTLWFRVKTMLGEPPEDGGEQPVVLGKIGQWPTLADLHTYEVAKYRKLLGAQYRELTRAIGLASHGVGIGSFVYLRRIFESLIEEAHARARAADAAFAEDEYEQARMDDKIKLLRDHLPNFLVENRQLYGILSTGIHALTEEQCLRYFDTVRTGIELILDERLEEQRKAAKIKSASAALAKARGEIAT